METVGLVILFIILFVAGASGAYCIFRVHSWITRHETTIASAFDRIMPDLEECKSLWKRYHASTDLDERECLLEQLQISYERLQAFRQEFSTFYELPR